MLPRINVGTGMFPVAAVAAIRADEKGVTNTTPWPKPFSAAWVVESAAGTWPVNVVMPGITKSKPTPYCLPAAVSASSGISVASLANVVLHDLANARVGRHGAEVEVEVVADGPASRPPTRRGSRPRWSG